MTTFAEKFSLSTVDTPPATVTSKCLNSTDPAQNSSLIFNCKDPHQRQSHCLRHARVWSLSACLIKGFCHISQSHLWGLAQSIPESKGKISLRCTGLLNIHSHFKCCPSVKSKWHWCLYQTPSSNFQKLFGWLRCSHSGRNGSFVRNGLPWPSLAYEGLGECILRGLPQSISGW